MSERGNCLPSFDLAIGLLLVSSAAGAQQYAISTVAGGSPTPSPTVAVNAYIGQLTRVAADSDGNVYFTSFQSVLKLDANGVLTQFAGNGRSGYSGDGGPATSAQLSSPQGLALDGSGNLYIADSNNSRVRMVSPSGIITTVAGSGIGGFLGEGDGGPATSAPLALPYGVAVDTGGTLFIADYGNNSVRKVSPGGVITTVAGGGILVPGDGGLATNVSLSAPMDVAVDWRGNVFIAEMGHNRIREVTPNGVITTVAGDGSAGHGGDGGPATSAQLSSPYAVAVDSGGTVYIADTENYRVRKVSTNGVISTFAGNGSYGYTGDGGQAPSSPITHPVGVSADRLGNVYIADSDNQRIRKVSASGVIGTVAGIGNSANSGDGGPATSAQLWNPAGVGVDGSGNLYIADQGNFRIRKISPGGIIATVAGDGTDGYSGEGGPATNAQLAGAVGLAVDVSGNIYEGEVGACRVRKISPGGTISTVAGNGSPGFSGDGGPATNAQLGYPIGMATDGLGNLYIADGSNNRVRKVSPDGTIATVAGGGTDYPGDGGAATGAKLSFPNAVAVDGAGNLYIADNYHQRIREVSPGGIITTLAGTGVAGYSGDGGPAIGAQLAFPNGVAVDGSGDLFIADQTNKRIRKVSPKGVITTVAGSGTAGSSFGYSGDGGPGASATFGQPWGVAVDADGDIFVTDSYANAVRKLTPVAALAIATGSSRTPARIGAPYSQSLAATGGFAPYTWAVASGALPRGLALSSAGTISGTPTAAGLCSFTVQATDSAGGTASASITLMVAPRSVVFPARRGAPLGPP